MQETLNRFCRVACASKAAFKLPDGNIVVLDLTSLKLMFAEYPDVTSKDATSRFMRVMDVLVEGFSPESGIKVSDVQGSYAWLKAMREVVSNIEMRVLRAERFEEMDRLDITKEMLFRAAI